MEKMSKEPTRVIVKINEQSALAENKLHLNLDIFAMCEGKRVPNQKVIMEVDGRRKTVVVPEDGLLKDQDVVFQCITGVRKRLTVWAEGSDIRGEYDISPKDFEAENSKGRMKELLLQKQMIVRNGEETTLEKDEYDVRQDILVEQGGILIIKPGVKLKFDQNSGIICYGILRALGGVDKIVFTGSAVEGWMNIALVGEGANGSRLESCVIEKGNGRNIEVFDDGAVIDDDDSDLLAGGGLAILNVKDITVSDVIIRGNAMGKARAKKVMRGGGVFISGGEPELMRCAIIDNWASKGGGVYVENSNPVLRNCKIVNNKLLIGKSPSREKGNEIFLHEGAGVYLSNSNPAFDRVVISSNEVFTGKDAGVALRNGSQIIDVCELKRQKELEYEKAKTELEEAIVTIKRCGVRYKTSMSELKKLREKYEEMEKTGRGYETLKVLLKRAKEEMDASAVEYRKKLKELDDEEYKHKEAAFLGNRKGIERAQAELEIANQIQRRRCDIWYPLSREAEEYKKIEAEIGKARLEMEEAGREYEVSKIILIQKREALKKIEEGKGASK